ncbi:MAG TPA: DUF2179 domain-containing protein [Thermoanaerobacterales bacterium]|jgi:uncharacterized protein YebE (UPF0316 family)|nr:DUF2179 domain-containing protein [Thermoanaerobacterales bacterium]
MAMLLLGYAFIFIARVIDVTLSTLRTLMVVRGKKIHAAVIGFFEVIVYIVALNKVVGQLSNPMNLFAYALGFSTGNYIGIYVEEKLAIGLTTVQIITQNSELCQLLRQKGFGVTVMEGMGKEGSREVLMVSLPRKSVPQVMEIIKQHDESAFVTIMDTKGTRGGYFTQTRKAK